MTKNLKLKDILLVKNPSRWGYALLIVAIYFAVKYLRPLSLDVVEAGTILRRGIHYSWYILPVLLYFWISWGTKGVWNRLGLTSGLGEGLLSGFLFTLPMLLGFAFIGEPKYSSWSFELIVVSALLPGLFEELYYRGFVFGELYKRAGWGFLLAAAFNGLVFGLAHIWQGNTLGETLGVFLVTFSGAAWFAWLYVEWRNNLWLPITLHILMNLYWALFAIESNALGGVGANVFRGITIAVSVIYTLRRRKPRQISRKELWWKGAEETTDMQTY